MKKKSKRILATALSAVMLMATVSGCGAKPATSESTQSAVPSQAQAEKLTVWLAPCGNKDLPDQDFWDEALKSFEEENNVDIAVEIVPWANYEEKYLTGITSGQGPDIGYMYVEMMNDFIDMGAIAPIDEYITPEERANYIY
ncbi:MAG: extracellular solute-binding protein, partial [Ruthenibacterium sp.]